MRHDTTSRNGRRLESTARIRTRTLHRLGFLVAAGAVLLALALTVGVGGAAADGMTVEPDNPEDHQPGDGGEGRGNASYAIFGVSDVAIDYVDGFEIRWDEGVASKCYNNDIRAYGIDRGDTRDDEGIDENGIRYTDRTSRTDDQVYVDFYPRDAFVGETTHLDSGDELVLAVENCVRNPAEPGWYRQSLTFNGTTEDGEYRETTLESNYVWVCECEGEAEAREELGPPPSERPNGGSDEGTESTGTPTPETTTTPQPTATPTLTPTSSSDPGPTGTDAARTSTDATRTETEAPEPTNTGSSAESTPAAGDGDGFGVLLALAAALLVGTLKRRTGR